MTIPADSEAGDSQGLAIGRLSRKTRTLFIAVAFGISVVTSVALLELGIRIIAPQKPSWLAIHAESPDFSFFVNQSNLDQGIDIGESQFRIITDARGHRIGEHTTQRVEAGRTVLALGDSFTFGNAVDYEDSFVGLLDAEPGWRATNAGVGGHGPEQYLAILKHELESGHTPDVVLVSIFAGNDVQDCAWNKDLPVLDGVAGGDASSLKDHIKRSSHLYRLLSNIYHAYFSPLESQAVQNSLFDVDAWGEPPLLDGDRDFRKAMSDIKITLEQAGVPLVVALIPMSETVRAIRMGTAESGELDYLLPNRQILGALESVGLDAIDPTAVLGREDKQATYFEFDKHFTPAGHRIYFEQIRGPVLTAP